MQLDYFKARLEYAGVVFAPGLSVEEVQEIEAAFALRFPPDLQAFLMFALPINAGFLDWRHASKATISAALAWPSESMCFDIEHNMFWLDEWGARPHSLTEAFAIAREALQRAPTLIPINGLGICRLNPMSRTIRFFRCIKPILFFTAPTWPIISKMSLPTILAGQTTSCAGQSRRFHSGPSCAHRSYAVRWKLSQRVIACNVMRSRPVPHDPAHAPPSAPAGLAT